MDASRLLLLSSVVMATVEFTGTVNATCEPYDVESFLLLEGEAFYFVPDIFDIVKVPPKEEFTWYKTTSKVEAVSSDERDRVHYHGEALFLLDLRPEDSGRYTAQHVDSSGSCSNYYLNATVFNTSYKNNSKFLYGKIKNADVNKKVTCPDPVMKPCKKFEGKLTWYKNFTPLQGKEEETLWVEKAGEKDMGIYTCVCSWTHANKTQISSGSRLLELKNSSRHCLEILSPINNTELVADRGSELKLNCSVFCGINTKETCKAYWNISNKRINRMDGYSETLTDVTEKPSQKTTLTSTLTIKQVSAEHFLGEFRCIGENFYKVTNSTTLRLKRRESIIPLVIGKLCVLGSFVFAMVLLKYCIVDLTLFFRRFLPVSSFNKDVRLYDAYVVYQTNGLDKSTEDTLYQFVTNILPSVLEEKCDYQLFIHGRDDLPGEDLMELVEERMKQSRRLMIILTMTPALLQTSVVGGFDWQVGFHHALIQADMKVILIQLGDPGSQGYANLPPSLQHLIRKSAPIKWPGCSQAAAAWNSRFWKRVRYLMPAVPVKRCAKSSVA